MVELAQRGVRRVLAPRLEDLFEADPLELLHHRLQRQRTDAAVAVEHVHRAALERPAGALVVVRGPGFVALAHAAEVLLRARCVMRVGRRQRAHVGPDLLAALDLLAHLDVVRILVARRARREEAVEVLDRRLDHALRPAVEEELVAAFGRHVPHLGRRLVDLEPLVVLLEGIFCPIPKS